MMIKVWLFSLVCSCASLFSAGPMFHLWAAERFCEICGIKDDKAVLDIIVGSEFPDIRYITGGARNLTHSVVSNVMEIRQSKTPFEMGMKLHAWLDTARENFIKKEVYDAIAPYGEGYSPTLLKFIEEEVLADCYDGRKWLFHFDEVLPEELALAQQDVIYKWHETIQWTIAVRPSWLLWAQSYRGQALGIPRRTLYNWSYLLPGLAKQPFFKNHLQGLLDYIEEELRILLIL